MNEIILGIIFVLALLLIYWQIKKKVKDKNPCKDCPQNKICDAYKLKK